MYLVRIKPEEEDWTLVYNDDSLLRDTTTVVDYAYKPSLEEIVDFLDHQAEDENHHDFVGKHKALAALLCTLEGRERATEILTLLAEYKGLDGMSPQDFGLKNDWSTWSLEIEENNENS